MELQHRLIRQTINIAVSKAIEDMKGNTRRSIRNLIDLALLFSQGENQKWFFKTAKKVISNPQNPYHALAARAVADIDNDTIKTVGLNLGYNSLIYGAGKLRKKQESMEFMLPWLLIFDVSDSQPDTFRHIENLIGGGQELGIYSYVFCPHEPNEIRPLCEIAKQFDECLFVFRVPSLLITEETIISLSERHNIAVSIQPENEDLSCDSSVKAFQILRQSRCLYGFHTTYNENNISKITAPDYIRSAIELGNLFGVYVADNSVTAECQETVYHFACNERGEKGQSLIALEWCRDIQNISTRILSGGGQLSVNLTERMYYEYIKVKEVLAKSLLEIFQSKRPTQAVNAAL